MTTLDLSAGELSWVPEAAGLGGAGGRLPPLLPEPRKPDRASTQRFNTTSFRSLTQSTPLGPSFLRFGGTVWPVGRRLGSFVSWISIPVPTISMCLGLL